MRRRPILFSLAAVLFVGQILTTSVSSIADEPPQIETFSLGMDQRTGFFDVYWDDAGGKVYLKLDRWDQDFLYTTALEAGLGSNPVGLDRGQLGESIVCRWQRVGQRVFLAQQNLNFRASEGSPQERQAVRDSFASSILWAGEVAARSGGAVLVDVTSLVLSDRHGITASLKSAGQGDYQLDDGRSVPVADALKAFPDNVELPAMLTFAAGQAGGQVRAVAADGRAFTLRQRISLIRLPDNQYIAREADPRIGAIQLQYTDYSVPLDASIFKSLMIRHRLELDDNGKVKEPIVYYVDSAAPEPVRGALLEGARWWSEAFMAAGFPDGFKVEIAPVEMDPLDIRFNFIQWVHRQTRGWSYGSSIIDPRTGEIIKGHVSLGSLRVRQDRLLIENLVARTAAADTGSACGMVFPASILAIETTSRDKAIELALARIRQLSAHEVGHTLGIAHNFAASTYGDRASVMDYPAPRFTIDDQGNIDGSDAYGVGVGIWDKLTIDCMYKGFPDEKDFQTYKQTKLAEAIQAGIKYISDADARPVGGAHPLAHLWDNGSNPVDELAVVLRVRAAALERFGSDRLLDGEPQGDLVRLFVPLYLHHRYQVEAVAKLIGGVDYAYSMPGDADAGATPVAVEQQTAAVKGLIDTIDSAQLVIDDQIGAALIPASRPTAWSIEEPTGFSGPVFDPLALAETAAALPVSLMLHPARMARLINQGVTVESHPGAELVLGPLTERVIKIFAPNEAEQEFNMQLAVSHRVATVVINAMIQLAGNEGAREDVRAAVRAKLKSIAEEIRNSSQRGTVSSNEAAWNEGKIVRFLQRPDLPVSNTEQKAVPPGSPIGGR